jgi:hypothetical protein
MTLLYGQLHVKSPSCKHYLLIKASFSQYLSISRLRDPAAWHVLCLEEVHSLVISRHTLVRTPGLERVLGYFRLTRKRSLTTMNYLSEQINSFIHLFTQRKVISKEKNVVV